MKECGVCGRSIKDDYELCIGCERKRLKVFGDCLYSGMSPQKATKRMNEVYPLKLKSKDAK